MSQVEHRGETYRLWSNKLLNNGDTFNVNGPHDKYGYVVECLEITHGPKPFKYLVKGTGDKKIKKC
jgi:hypothetical protein